jgi:transmembrane 9 superfamily member 3
LLLGDRFFEHQIHWFSIFNSFMMVIFLCGLVALILLRTLKNDYAKFAEDDAEELMLDGKSTLLKEDANSGWKLLHGDVFRAPPFLLLFTALIGTGAQLLVLSAFLMLIAIISSLYMKPGGVVSVGLTVYAFSSLANGYASGAFYHQFFYPRVSKDWIRAMVMSSALLPTVIFVTVFFINALAVTYGTTYAIPFVTIVQVILVWFFVSCPLAVLGTILGRHGAAKRGFPCRVNKFPREVPEARWYLRPPVMIALTGILPFGSIFIEMYFIFASFWNYKFYYVYGFMLLVFLILCVVTLCVTIVCTYFLLNAENYRWHWTSFAAAGSTALYVFLYAIYFYFFKTNMTGFLQTCFYFGYMYVDPRMDGGGTDGQDSLSLSLSSQGTLLLFVLYHDRHDWLLWKQCVHQADLSQHQGRINEHKKQGQMPKGNFSRPFLHGSPRRSEKAYAYKLSGYEIDNRRT